MRNRLKEERRLQEMTLRDLARFVGVDHSTLWLIENDRIENPKPALQARIARALRVPLDRVFPQ